MKSTTQNQYRDSSGGIWHIQYDPPPIPTRSHDWSATHEDYDGAPEFYDGPPSDDRHFTGASREDVIARVEEYVEDKAAGGVE